MKILPGPKIPTPFGKISLPDLETPPFSLPKRPNSRELAAIRHGLGQDLIDVAEGVIAAIPVAGSASEFISVSISDMHAAEIQKILTKDEYITYMNYNKIFPSSVALARTLLFPKVKTIGELRERLKSGLKQATAF